MGLLVGAALEQVGEVLAAVGVERQGIAKGTGDDLDAVDRAQGQDLVDMMGGVGRRSSNCW